MPRVPLVCAVDDDYAFGESLDGLLRSAGFGVRTFASAEAFFGWSTNHEADCIILDFAMPGMNGLEVRRALVERGLAVPVIFATAVGQEDVWRQLTSCGAFAVFSKPLDANALLDAVQRAVEAQ
jgi:FixJ family two-component response regulator